MAASAPSALDLATYDDVSSGRAVPEPSDRACAWTETPSEVGTQLTADTRLEDLAGNSIGRPFEVDEFDKVDESIEAKSVSLPFEVQPE